MNVSGVTNAATTDFTQPVGRASEHRGVVAGNGIAGEQHPGRVCGHHLLHHHRQRQALVRHIVLAAIVHGAVGPQRCPAPPYSVQYRLDPDHAEVGILLPGKLASAKSSAVAEDRTATAGLTQPEIGRSDPDSPLPDGD